MYQHPHGYLSRSLEKHQTKYFNEWFHLAQVIAKNKCEHFRGTPCIRGFMEDFLQLPELIEEVVRLFTEQKTEIAESAFDTKVSSLSG